MIEKKNRMIILKDYYGNLLTAKQQEYFRAYYEEDLSLGEIAENNDVSRNAVHKQLKNIEKIFDNYEEKLNLVTKGNKLRAIIKELKKYNISNELIKELENLE